LLPAAEATVPPPAPPEGVAAAVRTPVEACRAPVALTVHSVKALDLLRRPARIHQPARHSPLELAQAFLSGDYLLVRLRLRLGQCCSLVQRGCTLLTVVAPLALALALALVALAVTSAVVTGESGRLGAAERTGASPAPGALRHAARAPPSPPLAAGCTPAAAAPPPAQPRAAAALPHSAPPLPPPAPRAALRVAAIAACTLC
jgi:hypothetical protein